MGGGRFIYGDITMSKGPKVWCSFEEQADKLIERGLIVNNKVELIEFLKSHNYYYLTGYLYQYFDENTKTYSDTTNKDGKLTYYKIREIISFDSFLRALINYQIDIIERDIKTKVAYYIGEKYGALGYLTDSQFTQQTEFEKFKELLNNYIRQNRNQEFIKHHDDKYDSKLPIWVAVEIMPLGTLLKLFSYSDIKTKRKIVKCYSFNDLRKFESWFYCLVKFRNLVAHNNRLYRYNIKMTPKRSQVYPTLTGKVFDYIVVLSELYPRDSKLTWNGMFINVIQNIVAKQSFVDLIEYGFPENWNNIIKL